MTISDTGLNTGVKDNSFNKKTWLIQLSYCTYTYSCIHREILVNRDTHKDLRKVFIKIVSHTQASEFSKFSQALQKYSIS